MNTERSVNDGPGAELVKDALSHDSFADAVLRHGYALPQSSVIALQGPWGRGKTDVLRRIHEKLKNRATEGT